MVQGNVPRDGGLWTPVDRKLSRSQVNLGSAMVQSFAPRLLPKLSMGTGKIFGRLEVPGSSAPRQGKGRLLWNG